MSSLLVALLVAAAPAADAPVSWASLVEVSMKELVAKESALPEGDPSKRFLLNQDEGTFELTARNGKVARARSVFAGTYSTQSGSWLWGWGNKSLDAKLTKPLERIRAYGKEHAFPRLVSDRVLCTPDEAVALFAVAIHLLEAQGWYRAAVSPTSTGYLALFEVKVSETK